MTREDGYLEMITMGAIDKLAIRVSGNERLTDVVRKLLASGSVSYEGNKYYRAVRNLEPIGLQAILFYQHRRNGNYKLQILNSSTMGFSSILKQVNGVFDVDPLQAEIMRLDLAVDVTGYPVDWFRRNMWVVRKRSSSEYRVSISRRERVETLYFGFGLDLLCVYDKTAERRVAYRRLVKQNGHTHFPTFEDFFGHSPETPITRVERRYGGRKIPREIRTLGGILKAASGLNPFGPVRFLRPELCEKSINKLSGEDFIKGQAVARLVERYGLHETKHILDKKLSRNTNRFLAHLGNLVELSSDLACPDLRALYAIGIREQLSN